MSDHASSDHASGSNEAGFTAEEQAAFEAYAAGGDIPAPSDAEPADSGDTTVAAVDAPNAVTPVSGSANAVAGAPGDVVDPESDESDDVEANKGRFVRHGAFHKERERRKAAEARFTELSERFARGDERLRLLTEAMQRPAQAQAAAVAEPEQAPDPNTDIFGYVQHLERKLAEVASGQQRVTEAQAKAAEEHRAAGERSAIVGYYQNDIRQAVTADPSVGDAYNHLFQGRIAELMHFGMARDQATEAVRGEEFEMVRAAIQRNQSPAAVIVHLAKGRGFVPRSADKGATPPPANSETPAERGARIAAGQAASKSLSAAGGAPAGEVTLEQLAAMSEADFEKFAAANPRKLAALMGA